MDTMKLNVTWSDGSVTTEEFARDVNIARPLTVEEAMNFLLCMATFSDIKPVSCVEV